MKPPISTEQIRGAYTSGSFDAELIRRLCDEIDRLQAEAKPTPQQEGKTVDIRVGVSLSPNGEWTACGGSCISIEEILAFTEHGVQDHRDVLMWITRTLPVPEEQEFAAEVD